MAGAVSRPALLAAGLFVFMGHPGYLSRDSPAVNRLVILRWGEWYSDRTRRALPG